MYSWDKLLCDKTLKARAEGPSSWKAYPVDEFEKDYAEVINCKMFRYLQDKAQIFPLVRGRQLRTRLTHSMEVSAIGEQMGKMITSSAKAKSVIDFGDSARAYSDACSKILSTAGLLHDLGNPPFGHFGEASFGAWFEKAFADDTFRFRGVPVRDVLSVRMKNDLLMFDGNAQTLHILFKNTLPTDIENVTVTAATINTLIKYPTASDAFDKSSDDVRVHKSGFFLCDEQNFHKIREMVGISGCSRYPLTTLLEAADDIAYIISDIEDAYNDGVLSMYVLLDFFAKSIDRIPEPKTELENIQLMVTNEVYGRLKDGFENVHDADEENFLLKNWLEYVKNWLVYEAVHSFFNNYDAIMSGTYSGELLKDSWYGVTASILKKVIKVHVINSREKLAVELAGNRIISTFMDVFIPAVMYLDAEDENHRQNPVEKRFTSYLPDRNIKEYYCARTDDEAYNLYLRFMMVTDYICTLTDTLAEGVYHSIFT